MRSGSRQVYAWVIGLALFTFGGMPAIVSGQEWVEPQPIVDESSAAESTVDPATLDLWRPSGRPRIVVDRDTRELLHTVDIVDRPGRPLHFYGNTVRRRAHGLGWNLSNR